MLYYKKVERAAPVEMAEPAMHIRSTVPVDVNPAPGVQVQQIDTALFDEMNRTPLTDRKKLFQMVMEDNFSNLPVDDKLVILYKTMQINNEKTNNYILMCLAVLVVICLKMYSK